MMIDDDDAHIIKILADDIPDMKLPLRMSARYRHSTRHFNAHKSFQAALPCSA